MVVAGEAVGLVNGSCPTSSSPGGSSRSSAMRVAAGGQSLLSPSGHQLFPSAPESLLPHRPVWEKNAETRQAPESARRCCLNNVHLDRAWKSPLSPAAAARTLAAAGWARPARPHAGEVPGGAAPAPAAAAARTVSAAAPAPAAPPRHHHGRGGGARGKARRHGRTAPPRKPRRRGTARPQGS